MMPATVVFILQNLAVISGLVSAWFWFWSTKTQYKSIGHKAMLGSGVVVTDDALTQYFSEIGKKNMVAAFTSGLTALFFALIVWMQLVYGIEALG